MHSTVQRWCNYLFMPYHQRWSSQSLGLEYATTTRVSKANDVHNGGVIKVISQIAQPTQSKRYWKMCPWWILDSAFHRCKCVIRNLWGQYENDNFISEIFVSLLCSMMHRDHWKVPLSLVKTIHTQSHQHAHTRILTCVLNKCIGGSGNWVPSYNSLWPNEHMT